MKFIFQSDIHLRSTVPVNRKGDFLQDQLDHFNQLVDWAEEYDADILCGGDLMDAPVIGFGVFNHVLHRLLSFENRLVTCTGNHDVYFHNVKTLNDTALGGLWNADAIDLIEHPTLWDSEEGVMIHGISWEQPVTQPIKGMVNILLAHISVFEHEVPFYFKGEAYTAVELEATYPGFDLYLCGDIHIPFVRNKTVVSGSMMRQNIDQIDFKPRAYLIDTNTMSITPLFYTEKEDVFVVKDEQVEESMDLDNLVDALNASSKRKVSYKGDCLSLAKEDKPAQNVLKEVFDGIS